MGPKEELKWKIQNGKYSNYIVTIFNGKLEGIHNGTTKDSKGNGGWGG